MHNNYSLSFLLVLLLNFYFGYCYQKNGLENCDDHDVNNDLLDKWNGLRYNPDYEHPEFYDFLPSYYKVNIEYHLSNEKIVSGSGRTMYDTGANINVMNKEEFDRINRMTPLIVDSVSEKPVIGQADGSKMHGYLKTAYIWFTVSDSFGNTSKMVKMKFHVFASIGSVDVIIGRHFMQEASIPSVTEFPQVHSIKFGGFENNNSDLKNGVWFCLIMAVVLIYLLRNSNQGRVEDEGNYYSVPLQDRFEDRIQENLRRRRRQITTLADVYANEYGRNQN